MFGPDLVSAAYPWLVSIGIPYTISIGGYKIDTDGGFLLVYRFYAFCVGPGTIDLPPLILSTAFDFIHTNSQWDE
jgi:hypothetical protein